MNHLEFFQKYLGKPVDFDKSYGVQCVDLPRQYIQEVYGKALGSFGGSAWNGWVTGVPFDKSWKKVIRTPKNYPKEGDIIFWSEKRCKYGHVAVANGLCTENILRYADTNGTGQHDPVTHRFSDYKNVVGWYTKNP